MSRWLADIPDGVPVMLGANILVDALTSQSQFHRDCRALLERGARSQVHLFTPVSVAADVLHRTMVLETLRRDMHSGQRMRSPCSSVSLISCSA